ncbi:hypothetical protein RvY_02611-2 [Ramazzottius varieornatus]|uniref:Uncharacterized protein n=1 Tax=Ramazzottius varieornatus TaxID=947166 RepID=A0A1D1UVG1_RAMVA|nr:hypothetical protein RvY_02611-2 [Ramazzottius varieornatus]
MSQRRTKINNLRRKSRLTREQSSRTRSFRLSFAELIDVLEPGGPFSETEASAWKSIIDRNEQLIIFYQVDYIQASPNISKCVRIRRHRSDSNVDKLIPTVFVNQQLQSTYVKDLLGRKHLDTHDDLKTILDHLQDEQGRVGVGVNDGFGWDGDDDGSDDEEYNIIPKGSVRFPSILPSTVTSDASSYLPGYGEGIDVDQEVEYRLLQPKWEEDGQEEVLSEIPPGTFISTSLFFPVIVEVFSESFRWLRLGRIPACFEKSAGV